MKRGGAALLGAAALLALTSPASAGRFTAWYFGVDGGANWVEDLDISVYSTPVLTSNAELDFDMGWAAFASAGYAFRNSGWRVELEGGYRYNEVDTITPAALPVATPIDADLSQFTLMANAVYDFPSIGGMVFSLGAGVGADYARAKSAAIAPLVAPFEADEISLAFQGIAGLSYPITSWMDLTLKYRYLLVTDLNFEDTESIAPAVAHLDTSGNIQNHTVSMGLTFGGRGPDRPMVAAKTAPPPPPPPPPAARQYIVYFAFNKCSITSEADAVLSEAAAATRQLNAVQVKIVGHTDTVGSQSVNQKLSECRAGAAKSNMVQKGVPASSIQAIGKGETQLLIQTPDSVKEPQNRRATIDLN
jgi:OOP family OmpA-OmpF porin